MTSVEDRWRLGQRGLLPVSQSKMVDYGSCPGLSGGDCIATEIVLNPDKEYEIVDGRPQEKEMGGARHGGVDTRLIQRLTNFVEAGGLGWVYDADTTFRIGRNERLPDVSFVAAARIPSAGEPEGP